MLIIWLRVFDKIFKKEIKGILLHAILQQLKLFDKWRQKNQSNWKYSQIFIRLMINIDLEITAEKYSTKLKKLWI